MEIVASSRQKFSSYNKKLSFNISSYSSLVNFKKKSVKRDFYEPRYNYMDR